MKRWAFYSSEASPCQCVLVADRSHDDRRSNQRSISNRLVGLDDDAVRNFTELVRRWHRTRGASSGMTCSLVPAQKRWTQKRSSHLHPVVHDETVAETEFGGKLIQDCPGLERWPLAEQKPPLLYIARHDWTSQVMCRGGRGEPLGSAVSRCAGMKQGKQIQAGRVQMNRQK